MKIKFFSIVVLPVFLMSLCGCWVISNHKQSVEACGMKMKEVRENYKNKYVGKTQDVLLTDFGTPLITKNVFTSGVHYEEEWHYKIPTKFLEPDCGKDAFFYMNNKRVEAVRVW